MKKTLYFTLMVVLAATVSGFSQKTYTLDKHHARVGFAATHLGISHVEGNFKTFDATLASSKEDMRDAVITFTADVSSINTDVEYRDNDLKSTNFFDATKFPTIDFSSTAFKKAGGNKYQLYGHLTMHGVTKPVVLNAVFNGTAVNFQKLRTAGFTITGKVNRLDFGIGASPLATGVSNEIEVKANVEFTFVN